LPGFALEYEFHFENQAFFTLPAVVSPRVSYNTTEMKNKSSAYHRGDFSLNFHDSSTK